MQLGRRGKLGLLIFVLLLAGGATFFLLRGGYILKNEPEKRIKKVKEENLELSVTVDKGDFKEGKKIPLTISVTNASQEIEFLHYSTEQRFDLEVKDAEDKAVWRWSQGRFFGLVLTQVKLEPDESEDYFANWSQKDSAGNQVPPGKYTVIVKSTADEVTKTVSIKVEIVK